MNSQDSENPIITQFALGEVSPVEQAAVQEWIQSDPSLENEVAEIQQLADSLVEAAPIHGLHLSSTQRRRILQPPVLKPVPKPPRSRAKPNQPHFSFVSSIFRMAALLAVSFAAYWIGVNSGKNDSTVASTPETPTLGTAPSGPVTEHLIPADLPAPPKAQEQLIASASSPPVATVTVAPEPAQAPNDKEPTVTVAVSETPKGTFAKLPAFGLATTKTKSPFINASKTPGDSMVLYPRRLRQEIAAPKSALEAKPFDPASSNSKDASAPRKKPELYIHSWRTDVAACPWDSQLRLLRVNIQLPADQEAVQIGDSDYPLEIVFDPNNVREFRRMGMRQIPSQELRSAGTQVVWYEFRPNGSPASSRDSGKHIATVRLPSARFTTQTVGPFDSSSLQVLDRGQDWRNAREDFRLETAMIGLGILLDGGLPDSKLNHSK
jgi:hypothetical protein